MVVDAAQERCRRCGATAVLQRRDHRFDESGIANVILESVDVAHCHHCGSGRFLGPNVSALIDLIGSLADGNELRLAFRDGRWQRA